MDEKRNRALQRARRAAGFRSAKDFAETYNIDTRAYTTLERCGRISNSLTARDILVISDVLHVSADTVLWR